MLLSDGELALFAELLDEVVGLEAHLLRDRIETYLYLKGYFERPETEYNEYLDEWHAMDGQHDGYGRTEAEALAELKRNMGK